MKYCAYSILLLCSCVVAIGLIASEHYRDRVSLFPRVIVYRLSDPTMRSWSIGPVFECFRVQPEGSIFYRSWESPWNWAVFPVEKGQLKQLATCNQEQQVYLNMRKERQVLSLEEQQACRQGALLAELATNDLDKEESTSQ